MKQVNGERLWDRLMGIAQIGATKKGGVCRVTLTEEDKQGRDLFIKWCKEANCSIRIDAIGNIFARRSGTDPKAKSILLGSHLDSQPTGGKYDGVYGVLAALEVIESLNDLNIDTKASIEIASWTNEEGARFAPAMIGSGVFAGTFTLDYAYNQVDKKGVKLEEALDQIQYIGIDKISPTEFSASLEVHIEQGPILEAEEKTIGIVTGVQGIRWYDLIVSGQETHAGPSPMKFRRDPVKHSLNILQMLYHMTDTFGEDAKITIGYLDASPGVRNTVPGQLTISVDIRHPNEETLTEMHDSLLQVVEEYGSEEGFITKLKEIWHSPAVAFDQKCIEAVRIATKTFDFPAKEMVSGAGHDSVYVSKVIPTSMIFIPCKDGLSHNELESAKKEEVIAGANVLLHAALELSNT